MRKSGLLLTGMLVLTAVMAVIASPAQAASEWNQAGHDAGRTSSTDAVGPINPRPVAGWPVQCQGAREFPCATAASSAVLHSLGEEGTSVFAGGWMESLVHGFGPGGEILPGSWPAALDDDVQRYVLSTAIATASGEDHVYATSIPNSGRVQGRVWGLDASGEPRAGWPVDLGSAASPLVLALVEQPSERLYVTTFEGAQGGVHRVFALQADGSALPGWPVEFPKGWEPVRRSSPFTFQIYPQLAVGPDGSVYVLAYNVEQEQSAVLAFTPDGKSKQGWPFALPAGYSFADNGGIAVGDDGAVHVDGVDENESESRLYALSPDGELKPGWPVSFPGIVWGAPSVAVDGATYIGSRQSYTDFLLRSYDAQGNPRPGWPRRHVSECSLCPALTPVLAGDGKRRDARIYYTLIDGRKPPAASLYGADDSGADLPGFPLALPGGCHPESLLLTSDSRLIVSDVTTFFCQQVRGTRLHAFETD